MKDKLILLGTFFVLIILVILYLYLGAVTVEVSYFKVKDELIPESFNNYKILQISDYHNEKNAKINRGILEHVMDEEPDLIVITGDLVDANKTDIQRALSLVKDLTSFAPIYYVTGNHEIKMNNYQELENGLINLGVHILHNSSDEITINGDTINILGVDDPTIMKEDISDSKKMNAMLQRIDYNKDNYTILLSHRPELFDSYVENKMNLVFAGHAHGGQIRIPIIGGVIAPNQGLFPKYDCGKYSSEDMVMIVNRGIGNSILPLRINNKPELVVTILRHKKINNN